MIFRAGHNFEHAAKAVQNFDVIILFKIRVKRIFHKISFMNS